jgi:hypothetical protein
MDAFLTPLILFLAMLFLAVLAARTFAHRQIEFAGAPAVPAVLTSRLGFRAGLLAYCLLLIAFYLVATYNWGPLRQTFGPLVNEVDWLKGLAPLFAGGGDSQNEVAPWVVALVVTVLFTWDNKYNPFVVILEGVLDSLQVPDRAVAVYRTLGKTKFGRIEAERARLVAGDPDIAECRPEDFAADRRDLEYRWAHVCYLRYVLLSHLRAPRYARFFAQSTLQWDAVDRGYADRAQEVGLWLRGPRDYRDAIDILEHIASLKDAHYRLLACLAVTTSRSSSEVWDRISEISHADVQPVPGNLGRYVVLFLVTLFFAILIGRESSILAYRALVGPAPALISFDVPKLKFWVLVALFSYSLPIGVVLLSRCLMVAHFPFEARRYWGLYAVAFAFAYLLAAMALPVFAGASQFHPFAASYWHVVYDREMVWPLLPGFLAAFVCFRLDSPASGKDCPRAVRLDRAQAAAIAAGVALLVALLGVADSNVLATGEGFVIIWTSVLLGAAAGWLSRFETG